MTTNNPEVVAWRWRKSVVNDQGETIGTTAWKLGDAPGFLPWWTNEPLIRLSDYEALQAECEKLAESLETLLEVRVVKADVSYGLACAKAEQALAAYHNQGDES